MNKVFQMLGICFLVILIPFVDIVLVPIMLGLIFIPGIMIPVLGGFILVAFLHYVLIKTIIDACTDKK